MHLCAVCKHHPAVLFTKNSGSYCGGCAAQRISELEATIKHCDNCGSDWVDNGINAGCACERITELKDIVDKLPRVWRLNDEGELVRDCPVVPGADNVWLIGNDGTPCETRIYCPHTVSDDGAYERIGFDQAYDSEEAARAAKAEQEKSK